MTEEAFAEAAMTYARGEIGSPQGEMSGLTAEQMDEFTNANIIKKVAKNLVFNSVSHVFFPS